MKKNAGQIRRVKGTGLQIAIAQLNAIESVEAFDKENPIAEAARAYLKAHKNEFISEEERN